MKSSIFANTLSSEDEGSRFLRRINNSQSLYTVS